MYSKSLALLCTVSSFRFHASNLITSALNMHHCPLWSSNTDKRNFCYFSNLFLVHGCTIWLQSASFKRIAWWWYYVKGWPNINPCNSSTQGGTKRKKTKVKSKGVKMSHPRWRKCWIYRFNYWEEVYKPFAFVETCKDNGTSSSAAHPVTQCFLQYTTKTSKDVFLYPWSPQHLLSYKSISKVLAVYHVPAWMVTCLTASHGLANYGYVITSVFTEVVRQVQLSVSVSHHKQKISLQFPQNSPLEVELNIEYYCVGSCDIILCQQRDSVSNCFPVANSSIVHRKP